MNFFPNLATDKTAYDDIERIRAAGGRNEKEEALASFAATQAGKALINWCYNPFITFGVTQKKEPIYRPLEEVEEANDLPLVYNLLTQLAARDLTGSAAKEALTDAFRTINPWAAHILWLCLNKDLKAGVAESSIRAVDPALIPTFAVMRAHTYEERLVTQFPVGVEPKLDGNRVTFIARDGSGGYFTRTGKVIASLDHMVPVMLNALKAWHSASNGEFAQSLKVTNGIPSVVLDGEMMSDAGFNEVNGALNRKEDVHGLTFHIFDSLSWEEFDAMGSVEVPYAQRRLRVNSIVVAASGVGLATLVKQTPIKLCHTHEEISASYDEFRAQGYEGAMVKVLSGSYDKKKSRNWLKLKAEDTEDLPIIGVFQGQDGGKYADTVGGFVVDRSGVEVRISGIEDAVREEIWKLWCADARYLGVNPVVGYGGASHKEALKLVKERVAALSEDDRKSLMLLGRLIEVEFHEVTPDGSLRHPRFVQFRDDKTGEIEK